jgi:protein-tyrosine phosphatase
MRLERSIDVHCHCLPGLDDGPGTLDEAVELCRWLAADGITSVVATPHQLGRYDLGNSAAKIAERLALLEERLEREAIPLEVVPGADVRIDERLPRLVSTGEVMTVGDLGAHLLLELPNSNFCEPRPVIAQLEAMGVQCIMTHPERHRYLNGSIDVVRGWIREGAVVQITAGSLLGDFGRYAFDYGWALVGEGLVSLVATDAHDTRRRPPRLTDVCESLDRYVGADRTRLLCGVNPLEIWRGNRLTPPPV